MLRLLLVKSMDLTLSMAMLKRLAQVSESAGTSLRAKNRRTHTHTGVHEQQT